MATFTSGATIDKVLDKLRKHLNENADDLRRAFQLIDKDRSNQISTDEFVEVLREMKIVLPPSTLLGLIERFDLNGDGTISIPEFMAFMSGDSDRMEVLASAAAVGPSISDRPAPAPEPDLHSIAERRLFGASNSGPLQISASETAFQFLSRMQGDIEERRRTAFINEIKKDPRFVPSMLENPKSKFQTVSLDGGPIIKVHNPKKTGLETARPFKWGPLGGYY